MKKIFQSYENTHYDFFFKSIGKIVPKIIFSTSNKEKKEKSKTGFQNPLVSLTIFKLVKYNETTCIRINIPFFFII